MVAMEVHSEAKEANIRGMGAHHGVAEAHLKEWGLTLRLTCPSGSSA
jgi:hypothetical protein